MWNTFCCLLVIGVCGSPCSNKCVLDSRDGKGTVRIKDISFHFPSLTVHISPHIIPFHFVSFSFKFTVSVPCCFLLALFFNICVLCSSYEWAVYEQWTQFVVTYFYTSFIQVRVITGHDIIFIFVRSSSRI